MCDYLNKKNNVKNKHDRVESAATAAEQTERSFTHRLKVTNLPV